MRSGYQKASLGFYDFSGFSEPADIIGIRRTGQLDFDSVQPAAEIRYQVNFILVGCSQIIGMEYLVRRLIWSAKSLLIIFAKYNLFCIVQERRIDFQTISYKILYFKDLSIVQMNADPILFQQGRVCSAYHLPFCPLLPPLSFVKYYFPNLILSPLKYSLFSVPLCA